MERQFFSGNTIEQAVMAAARHYGLDPSRVAYKPRDKKHGFLNIRRRVVIEVDPEAPEKPEAPAGEIPEESAEDIAAAAADDGGPSADERPRQPSRERLSGETPSRETPSREHGPAERRPREQPASRGGRGAGKDAGRDAGKDEAADEIWRHRKALEAEFAEELLEEGAEGAGETSDAEGASDEDKELVAFEMALDELVELVEMELEATITRGDDVIEIEIEGEDGEFLVERDGLLLRAIEHLLPRMVRGLIGYGLPCRVDCEGFHEARERELREIAGGMAELARRQGKPQKLEPMSPADRRLVHLALADDPTVRTESEGGGYMKRVKVLPA